ncbi:putative phage abortive infection protein [Pseudomonas sp. S07E 245]|uniref:putative phage abortive infection protein n=1 Tax=Pseudomonas sp. S07E 245 TaxID=2866278 RepID=UPI001C73CD5F|nr:putative phage abortive infection protein [Pseudomonas sp. S07E 245]QYX54400.1 putative phage abortive infection protein [Pseudomonas sp. S07E 245]
MNKIQYKNDRANIRLVYKAAVAVGFFILIVLLAYLTRFHSGLSDRQDAWGQFGDYFGGLLNPILSFCAFIALLVTLVDQREAARDSESRHRIEVSDVRFFQMLALLPQSVSDVKYCDEKHTVAKYDVYLESRAATQKMWNSLYYRMNNSFRTHDSIELKYQKIRKAVELFSSEVWPLTGFYFQLVYAIVKFVSKSGSPGDSSFDLYMSLLKSQLTEHERLLVFYISFGSDRYLDSASVVLSAGFCDVALTIDALAPIREDLLKQARAHSQPELS